MSLNQILAVSESVEINDQRFVGQVISRNQRITTSEQMTVVPFKFTLRPMNYLLYSQSRDLLASLRYYDKALTQYLNFGSTGWSAYIAYQGDMTSGEIATCEWQTSSANTTLVLGSLPTMGAGEYIVRAGDFCQVDTYTYIATSDVVRGSGSTVNIPVHRNLIEAVASPVAAVIGEYGTTISLGGSSYTGVTFPVILREYPTYALVPMGADAYIQWTGTFQAFEAVQT
jgi:hypothetical protein